MSRDDDPGRHLSQLVARHDGIDRDDDALTRRDHDELHGAGANEHDIAILVCCRSVQQQDIWSERRCRSHMRSGHRVDDRRGELWQPGEIGADGPCKRFAGQASLAGEQRLGECVRGPLDQLQGPFVDGSLEQSRLTEDVKAAETEGRLRDGTNLEQHLQGQATAPAGVVQVPPTRGADGG